jgi:hypothetical protein
MVEYGIHLKTTMLCFVGKERWECLSTSAGTGRDTGEREDRWNGMEGNELNELHD